MASFCCLLVVFGGLYMRAIDPTLAVADNAVIEYVKMFHPIISTILSVAIIGAIVDFYLYLISGIERSVMAAGAWGMIVSFVVMFVLAAILNRKKKLRRKSKARNNKESIRKGGIR